MNSPDAPGDTGAVCPALIAADRLNHGCACRSLDAERLRRELECDPVLAGMADEIARSRPHLFAALAVFISRDQFDRMAAIIAAAEQVVAIPAYRDAAIARAPAAAGFNFGPQGAFTGFDFHLANEGPQLIEINTNSGGALLNAALVRAQYACCQEMVDAAFTSATDVEQLDAQLLAMFRKEWQLQRGTGLPGRMAVVDDDPSGQYLYPEFLLFQRLLRQAGIETVVADAKDLEWRNGKLLHEGRCVDMVYNRLTDFYLEDLAHGALRSAYESGAVVLTPHPQAHALYADKRNLVTLGDTSALTALGVPASASTVLLGGVPRTELVTPATADALWAGRRSRFFKPVAGYGGKAAYRGDKLTRRVWQDVLAGQYVAQVFVPPSERIVNVDDANTDLKVDIRAYTYEGKIQLLAARLYQGQTTNFRTAGGGFAPVFMV